MLVAKTLRAAAITGRRVVAVSGGVSCNSRLREKMAAACAAHGLELLLAEPALCTDNAAMIGYVAALRLAHGDTSPLTRTSIRICGSSPESLGGGEWLASVFPREQVVGDGARSVAPFAERV